jgi:hypothetical protein
MLTNKSKKTTFLHECKVCGAIWFSTLQSPVECGACRSRDWFDGVKRSCEIYIPIPTFDHSEKRKLKGLGCKCPYCNGTTGIDSVERVAFCYSCDFCWDLSLNPLGVKEGIGIGSGYKYDCVK